jgi:selT/selW/selH-like putative selenoprotein
MPGTEVELVKGGRGDFIVTADGRLVWSKKQQGDEFPDEGVVVEALRRMA